MVLFYSPGWVYEGEAKERELKSGDRGGGQERTEEQQGAGLLARGREHARHEVGHGAAGLRVEVEVGGVLRARKQPLRGAPQADAMASDGLNGRLEIRWGRAAVELTHADADALGGRGGGCCGTRADVAGDPLEPGAVGRNGRAVHRRR